MAYPWQPLVLPLASGMDEGVDPLTGDPRLNDAVNIEVSREGVLRPRPGYGRHQGVDVQHINASLEVTYDQFSDFAAAGFIPRAIFPLRDASGERPGIYCHGRLFSREGSRWVDRRGASALRVNRRVLCDSLTNGNGVFAWDFTGGSTGYTLLGPTGSVERVINDLGTSGDFIGGGAACLMGTDSFAITIENGTNNLVLWKRSGGAEVATRVTIRTDCVSDDIVSMPKMDTDGTILYVIYKTTTAGQYRVLRVNASGTVLTNQAFAPGGTITAVAVAYKSSTALIVGHTRSGAGVGIRTKVLNASTLADQALDVDMGGVATFSAEHCALGAGPSGRVWGIHTTSSGVHAVICSRSTSAATALTHRTYYGGSSPFPTLQWNILHQPIRVQSRDYVGLVASVGHPDASYGDNGMWWVLDITDLHGVGSVTGTIVEPVFSGRGPLRATGAIGYAGSQVAGLVQGCGSAVTNGTSFRFGVWEFTRFDATASRDPRLAQYECTPYAPPTAQAGDATYLGGSTPHMVSGRYAHEVGFPFLGSPELFADVSAGGSVPAGSYTFQACWRWTDTTGTIHRSGVSLPMTVVTTGGANQTINVRILNPQMTEREGVVIELYATVVNPPSGAQRFLRQVFTPTAASHVTQTSYAGANDFLTFATGETLTNQEVIYTYPNVLNNDPPSADGGLAALGRRLWMSDGSEVRASKYLKVGQAPAWNDEDPLLVRPPATAGRVLALAPVDEKLFILCERGIFVTAGDGPDNAGIGPDFAPPMPVSPLGIAGPRSYCVTPAGIVFQAANGEVPTAVDDARGTGGLYLLDRSLQVRRISSPVTSHVRTAAVDMAFLPERDLLVCTTELEYLLTLNLRNGAWSRWVMAPTMPVTAFTAVGAVNGVLWALDTPEPGSFDHPTLGVDDDGSNRNFTMSVTTTHLAAAGDGLGWGRVRSVRVLGRVRSTTHSLTIIVTHDGFFTETSAAFSMNPTDVQTTWPTGRYAPEWRLGRQRTSQLQVTIKATPATAHWTALELQVQPHPRGRSPSRQRA